MKHVIGFVIAGSGVVAMWYLQTIATFAVQYGMPALMARLGTIFFAIILLVLGIYTAWPRKKSRQQRKFGISPFDEVGDGLVGLRHKKPDKVASWVDEKWRKKNSKEA